MLRRPIATLLCLLLSLGAAAAASGSVLVARDAKGARLEIDRHGRALVTYRQSGRGVRHVLAFGAVDEQTSMRLDYSGGHGAFGRPLWRAFRDVSTRYDDATLPWLVSARTAPDGSHWALQAWPRGLPNHGASVSGIRAAPELHLSHWRGELPRLEVWVDWVFHGRYQHLFGRLTYQGRPVYGLRNTPAGRPLDKLSRNLYLDTFDSAYGPGWKRENAFLTHRPNGNFCYGFYPRTGQTGAGSRYRITVMGPGATPDVMWEGAAPGAYDDAADAQLNALGEQVANGDPRCQRR